MMLVEAAGAVNSDWLLKAHASNHFCRQTKVLDVAP
jgi:hypothetical protein